MHRGARHYERGPSNREQRTADIGHRTTDNGQRTTDNGLRTESIRKFAEAPAADLEARAIAQRHLAVAANRRDHLVHRVEGDDRSARDDELRGIDPRLEVVQCGRQLIVLVARLRLRQAVLRDETGHVGGHDDAKRFPVRARNRLTGAAAGPVSSADGAHRRARESALSRRARLTGFGR